MISPVATLDDDLLSRRVGARFAQGGTKNRPLSPGSRARTRRESALGRSRRAARDAAGYSAGGMYADPSRRV